MCYIHDNARDKECTGAPCPEWSDLGGFYHTLQNSLKPELETQTLSKLHAKFRKLVSHFKHFTTVTEELHKLQNMFDVPNHELLQDLSTH